MSDSMRERGTGRSTQSLFGGTAGRLPPASNSSAMRDALETDNDRLAAELEGKVAALKMATQGIHDEVTEQNRFLSGMSLDFDRTGNLMGGTLKKLDELVKYAGGSKHMCVMIIFTVLVLLGLWWVLKR